MYQLLSVIVKEYAVAKKMKDGFKMLQLKALIDGKKYIDDINGNKAHPSTRPDAVKKLERETRTTEVPVSIPTATVTPEVIQVQTKVDDLSISLEANEDLFKPSI